MIINTYDDPRKSYYYVGSIIIKHLLSDSPMRLGILYKNVCKVYRCNYKLFMSTIIWLYIENIIEYDNGVYLIK